VNGRQLPAPANPEQMLRAIYGSSWRTPDPAFRFVTPPAAARRFFWWLNHYDVDRENWEDTHRGAIAAGMALTPTAFAKHVAGILPPSSTLLELGCGLGGDAQYLADLGHHVLAVDFSRPAVTFAVERAGAQAHTGDGSLRYERINLNAMRQVAHLRALCAALPGPVSVYGRGIFNALSPLGWDTTLKLLQHLLAGTEGRGYLEVEVGCDNRPQSWTDYGPVSFQRFQEQLTRYDLGIVESREDITGSSGEVRTVRQVTVRGLK
jgi:SAM-dependent methyltransferase